MVPPVSGNSEPPQFAHTPPTPHPDAFSTTGTLPCTPHSCSFRNRGHPLPPHETLPLPPPPVGRAPPTGRTTSASWILKHLQLIQSAISSITVGQFEDRVYAILMHTPPGAKLIPLADNTGLDPQPLAPPTQVTMDDDDTLGGMAQTTVPQVAQTTDRILKAIDRHSLNGDVLKARRSTKGPFNRSFADSTPRDRMTALSRICWRPAVNPWTILLSVLKTRTPWRATSWSRSVVHRPASQATPTITIRTY